MATRSIYKASRMNNHKTDRPEIRLPKPEIIRNSEVDPAVLNYESVLPNLLTLELNYLVSFRQIFQNKQTDIKPWMRSTVIRWMLDVSNELKLEKETYEIAINILDRMLSLINFKRDQFQLLASAALLIAGKLKETFCILPQKLIVYTADSITFEALVQMESLVLESLKWDVSAPTVSQFIEVIVPKYLDFLGVLSPEQKNVRIRDSNKENLYHCNAYGENQYISDRNLEEIRLLSMTIARKAVIEVDFIGVNPSILASVSVIIAISEILDSKIIFKKNRSIIQLLCEEYSHNNNNSNKNYLFPELVPIINEHLRTSPFPVIDFSNLCKISDENSVSNNNHNNSPYLKSLQEDDGFRPSPRRRKSVGGEVINIYDSVQREAEIAKGILEEKSSLVWVWKRTFPQIIFVESFPKTIIIPNPFFHHPTAPPASPATQTQPPAAPPKTTQHPKK